MFVAIWRVLILAFILYVIGYVSGDKLLSFESLTFAVAFTALERTCQNTSKEPVA